MRFSLGLYLQLDWNQHYHQLSKNSKTVKHQLIDNQCLTIACRITA